MISLPIDSHLPQILKLVEKQKNSFCPLILTASPGSGKTTRLPALLLKQKIKFNLTQKEKCSKKIIVIVPKRVSAISAADRVADELQIQLGHEIGYQVRFDQKISQDTQLIYMTEGLFIKKMQDHKFWEDLDTVILDEFHERSSQLDIILGLCYEMLLLEPKFNLIVMSATLNINQLRIFFESSETYEIQAPPFKLEVFYSDKVQRIVIDDTFYSSLKDTLLRSLKIAKKDILVFLPGLKEILTFKNLMQPLLPQMQFEVLHGSISLSDQKRIIQKNSIQNLTRRIILSTNIAESSVTVQGIDCVIDTGLEKNIFKENKIGFTGLNVDRISLFSAQQRAGRAAREQDGYCFKLWHEIDERSMKEQADPEIISSSLIEEILTLKKQQIQQIEHFSWLTKPKHEQLKIAVSQLTRWHLLDEKNQLTEKAEIILSWPLAIEFSLITYELIQLGFANEAYKIATAMDSGKVEQILSSDNSNQSDLFKIVNAQFNQFNLQNNLNQISRRCVFNHTTMQSNIQHLDDAMVYIYTKYFPEKIAVRKKSGFGLSLRGRGIQFAQQSDLNNHDYFIIMSGHESHQQSTQLVLGFGFDKKIAQKYFSDFSKKTIEIHYDFEKHEFYKYEKIIYENIVLNDLGKSRLSEQEINMNWKSYFIDNASDFLKAHHQYEHFKILTQFIVKFNESYFNLEDDCMKMIEEIDHNLAKLIINYYSTIQDFLNCDLLYLSYQIFDEKINFILQNLPKSIKSPRGKTVNVNYSDEKAPLISLKIQDAFGWSDTPKIYNNQIPLTLELLAPNYRPAQITNRLGLFWETSYADVRKDLRARYPKHDWPEDPRSMQ